MIMDNHTRRVNYVVQNTGMEREAADQYVRFAYATGTDLNLRPAQQRRIRHGRAADGAHRQRQREAAAALAARQQAHWGPAYGAPAAAVRGPAPRLFAVDEISEISRFLKAGRKLRHDGKPRLFQRKSG